MTQTGLADVEQDTAVIAEDLQQQQQQQQQPRAEGEVRRDFQFSSHHRLQSKGTAFSSSSSAATAALYFAFLFGFSSAPFVLVVFFFAPSCADVSPVAGPQKWQLSLLPGRPRLTFYCAITLRPFDFILFHFRPFLLLPFVSNPTFDLFVSFSVAPFIAPCPCNDVVFFLARFLFDVSPAID